MSYVVMGLALCAGLALWARRRYVVITVVGGSMLPSLHNGDRVLVRRAGLSRVRAGDVVVMRFVDNNAGGDEVSHLIKRAIAVPGDEVPRDRIPALAGAAEPAVPPGKLVLLGDNRTSMDSKQAGYFPGAALLGIVIRHLAPARPH
jgi:signal peptidase I